MHKLTLMLVLALPATSQSAEIDEQFFRQRIAPVLERSCVGCHRGVAARAGLSLDSAAGLAKGSDNGPVIDKSDPGSSTLLQMISGDQPEMPKEGDPLPDAEVADLTRWVAAGAPWPADVMLQDKRGGKLWWSLSPLAVGPPPALDDAEARAWIRNPIDAFVLARLRSNGIAQAPEADRRTLLRRLTFDLHGLPPTPVEVESFVNDVDPNAYEKLVDRLLASPRYGERWTRHWLDVVHFGETHGYDKDKRRDHAWPYRDYVIRSFHNDKPYAQFVREQIAGDVLLPGEPEGLIATGFIAAGPWDFVGHVELREGTVEKAKTRALDRDDMVANTMSTFTSMTVHCARCHDHAFDPIPQKDHYRLQAVFAGVDRKDIAYDEPSVARLRASIEARKKALDSDLAQCDRQAEQFAGSQLSQIDQRIGFIADRLKTLPTGLAEPSSDVTSATNGFHSAIADKPDVVKWVQVDLGEPQAIDSIRLIPARPTDFPDSPGFGFPLRFRVELSDGPDFNKPVVVDAQGHADVPNPGPVPYVILVDGARARFVRVTAEKLWKRTNDYVFALAEAQVESSGRNIALGMPVTALDSIEGGRWSASALVDGADSRSKLPAIDAALSTELRERLALETRLRTLRKVRSLVGDLLLAPSLADVRSALRRRAASCDLELAQLPAKPVVFALESHAPRQIRVLDRGDVEKPLEVAEPGGLSCLLDLPASFALSNSADEGSRRVALADWITDKKNCLTWRSIVNRVWHYHFGRGIVETPNDFGRNGGEPSHPELLDWLAIQFRDGRQSLKSLHRLIVTSATYRQVVAHNPEAAKLDASNRLLWRMNRRRLEAEEIRDAVLAISDKLDLTMGGPSFEPFEFKDDHSPHYNYVAMDKPEVWRRSVYRRITRSVPDPWMEALDCPDPSLSAPVRTTTVTALQALATLNDDFMVRQAEYAANRLTGESPNLQSQIDRAVLLCTSRNVTDAEREILTEYARRHGLANLCRLLFNSSEFVFVD